MKNKEKPQDGDVILPCPFCGKAPYITEWSDGWSSECDNEDCIFMPCTKRWFHKREQVVEAWNTRAK